MGKGRKQLELALTQREPSPEVLSPQAERALVQALAELLLLVARARETEPQAGGDDERKAR